jgi:hypothetical protein
MRNTMKEVNICYITTSFGKTMVCLITEDDLVAKEWRLNTEADPEYNDGSEINVVKLPFDFSLAEIL